MNSSPLYRRTLPSPIGTINVIATGSAIAGVLWDTDAVISDGAAHNPVEKHFAGRTIIDVQARRP